MNCNRLLILPEIAEFIYKMKDQRTFNWFKTFKIHYKYRLNRHNCITYVNEKVDKMDHIQ